MHTHTYVWGACVCVCSRTRVYMCAHVCAHACAACVCVYMYICPSAHGFGAVDRFPTQHDTGSSPEATVLWVCRAFSVLGSTVIASVHRYAWFLRADFVSGVLLNTAALVAFPVDSVSRGFFLPFKSAGPFPLSVSVRLLDTRGTGVRECLCPRLSWDASSCPSSAAVLKEPPLAARLPAPPLSHAPA